MLTEYWFLVVLGFIWITVAVIMDFRKREIENWWNFSIIAVALAYRALVSIGTNDYWFFIYGIGGFALFFALANLFYYARVFAGGDAKLFMALGAILPLSNEIYGNLIISFYFVLFLLVFGSIYGLIYSFILVHRNLDCFSREIKKQFKVNKKILGLFLGLAIIMGLIVWGLGENVLFILPVLVALCSLLFVYAKAIEQSCMIRSVEARDLTVGDWLAEKVKIGKKTISPYWEGLSEKQVEMFKKLGKRKIKLKEGIPFTPAFWLAFIALIICILYNFI